MTHLHIRTDDITTVNRTFSKTYGYTIIEYHISFNMCNNKYTYTLRYTKDNTTLMHTYLEINNHTDEHEITSNGITNCMDQDLPKSITKLFNQLLKKYSDVNKRDINYVDDFGNDYVEYANVNPPSSF